MDKAEIEIGMLSDETLLDFYRKIEKSVRVVMNTQALIIEEATSRLLRGIRYSVIRTTEILGNSTTLVELQEPVKFCTFAYNPSSRAFGHFDGESRRVSIIHTANKTAVMAVGEFGLISVDGGATDPDSAGGIIPAHSLDPRAYLIFHFDGRVDVDKCMMALGYYAPEVEQMPDAEVDPRLN